MGDGEPEQEHPLRHHAPHAVFPTPEEQLLLPPAPHVDLAARPRVASVPGKVVRELSEPKRERRTIFVVHRSEVLPRVRDPLRHHALDQLQ